MPFMAYVIHRVLIWTKTYPELSTRYIETVCTAGVLEDGSPVRPVPNTVQIFGFAISQIPVDHCKNCEEPLRCPA